MGSESTCINVLYKHYLGGTEIFRGLRTLKKLSEFSNFLAIEIGKCE